MNHEINNDLKISGTYYDASINDLPGSLNNWSWAETQPWVSGGNGSINNPYIIDGHTFEYSSGNGHCLTIVHSRKHFKIQNCTFRNSEALHCGIYFYNVTNGQIIDNEFYNNYYGLYQSNSNYTLILRNDLINNNRHGLYLSNSHFSQVLENNISSNTHIGIRMDVCTFNNVSKNIIKDNENSHGIYIDGNNMNNTVSKNSIKNNGKNSGINDAYGIMLHGGPQYNNITNNIIIDNDDVGIYINMADKNLVKGNTIKNNPIVGIELTSTSDNNKIYENYFKNNGKHAEDSGNFNTWNSSTIGNYWDNYIGYDDDFNGIGDTPHNFGTGIDYLPIWNFQSPIHIDDSATGVGAHNWTWAESQPWCFGSGTFSAPYIIDGLNITARGVGSSIMIENSYKYFKVQNCKLIESGSGTYDAGILLDHSMNGKLINNNCSFNRYGIRIYYSDNTTVSGNTVNDNSRGTYISYSDNNTVSGNTANDNTYGIYLSFSDINTVSGNTANDNAYGIYLSFSDNNTVSGNTANDNGYGISIVDHSYSNTISGNTANYNNFYGIYLSTSDNNTISGNTANNNHDYGVYILGTISDGSDNNTVSGNTIYNNQDIGIRLYRSNSTTISGNIVDNNVIYGIYTGQSVYNLIYKNYFINNGIHALDVEGHSNNWNSSIIGNYWDNYAGNDDDLDGIGDSPHNFGSGIDYLPIWNFQSPIHIDDLATGVGAHNWTWAESQPWCTGSGTFSDPYIINGLNITARGVGNGILIKNSDKYFKVQNCKLIESGSDTFDAGILLDHAGNGTLINNNCSFNNRGICLYYSDNNTISENYIHDNVNGLRFYNSHNNTLNDNMAYSNYAGIQIHVSDNNTVFNNNFSSNSYGLRLRYGHYSKIFSNYVSENTYGIYIDETRYCDIYENTIENNVNDGIWINDVASDNNTIYANDINSNGRYGLLIDDSGCQYNEMYLNNFNDNNINAYDNGTDSRWDDGDIGNYWDDYAGVDANDDGIGDTPYLISGIGEGQDNFPIWADGDDVPPVITIISPLSDSVFGLDAPNYQITIVELNLDTIWYTLDGGITNYTITDLTGTFNQLAWGVLSEGNFTIKFYANDTAGNIGFIDVEVIIEIPEDIDDLPIISFGNYYVLFTFITILSFVILEKRKKK